MHERALARHRAGVLRTVELRASDFVGPGSPTAGCSAPGGPAAADRPLGAFLGDPDVPHSWTAVPDVAAALELAAVGSAPGVAPWHVPTAPPGHLPEAVAGSARRRCRPRCRCGGCPHLALRAAGLLSPLVRELEETRHQFVRPFVLDSSAFTTAFGLPATPLETTWADTVAWWRDRVTAQADR
jgi:nucleoside-diphosphate-sugar epimerase